MGKASVVNGDEEFTIHLVLRDKGGTIGQDELKLTRMPTGVVELLPRRRRERSTEESMRHHDCQLRRLRL
jgi:hypothetical protein